ncbi:MAG: hypothetical protein EXQ91_07485 [Alphaproteobacteria bacterium]|nr:hypothetical protein [Alphaproteobacteria bacterium]
MKSPRRAARTALAALLFSTLLIGGGRAADFLEAIEDVPLMATLRELPETAVLFDKPSGRIVDVHAVGPMKIDDVIAFYRATLPQLGWSIDPALNKVPNARAFSLMFTREVERLTIDVTVFDSGVNVRFGLTPR